MVNFPLSSKFSFTSSTPTTPSSSSISSRSRTNPCLPTSPAPKSPPTTALSDLSNCSDSFPLARRPTKRPKTADHRHHYTSLSDLLSIPPSVLDRETEKSEREREQRERDRQEGKPVTAETPWTAPPTPDLYFLPYRPSLRAQHQRSRSDPSPSPTVATFDQPLGSGKVSPTRPCFNRTQTDPGLNTSPKGSIDGGSSRRSSTGSPQRHELL